MCPGDPPGFISMPLIATGDEFPSSFGNRLKKGRYSFQAKGDGRLRQFQSLSLIRLKLPVYGDAVCVLIQQQLHPDRNTKLSSVNESWWRWWSSNIGRFRALASFLVMPSVITTNVSLNFNFNYVAAVVIEKRLEWPVTDCTTLFVHW